MTRTTLAGLLALLLVQTAPLSAAAPPITPVLDSRNEAPVAVLFAPVSAQPRVYQVSVPVDHVDRYERWTISKLNGRGGPDHAACEPVDAEHLHTKAPTANVSIACKQEHRRERVYLLEKLPPLTGTRNTTTSFNLVPLQAPLAGEEVTFRLWRRGEENPERYSALRVIFQTDVREAQRLVLIRDAVSHLEPDRARRDKTRNLVHLVLDEDGQRYGYVCDRGLARGMRFERGPDPADMFAELDETDQVMVHMVLPRSKLPFVRVKFGEEAVPATYRFFPAEPNALTAVKAQAVLAQSQKAAGASLQDSVRPPTLNTAVPGASRAEPDPYVHVAFVGGPFAPAAASELQTSKKDRESIKVYLPTVMGATYATTTTAVEPTDVEIQKNCVTIPLLVQENITFNLKLGIFNSDLTERDFEVIDGRVRNIRSRKVEYAFLIVPHIWDWDGAKIRWMPPLLRRIQPMFGFGYEGFPRNVYLGLVGQLAAGFDIALGIHSRRVEALPQGTRVGDRAAALTTLTEQDSELFIGVTLPLTVFSKFYNDIFTAPKN